MQRGPCKVKVKAPSLQYGDILNHQEIAFKPLRLWRVKEAALFHSAEFLQCLPYPKAALGTSAVHEMADLTARTVKRTMLQAGGLSMQVGPLSLNVGAHA